MMEECAKSTSKHSAIYMSTQQNAKNFKNTQQSVQVNDIVRPIFLFYGCSTKF